MRGSRSLLFVAAANLETKFKQGALSINHVFREHWPSCNVGNFSFLRSRPPHFRLQNHKRPYFGIGELHEWGEDLFLLSATPLVRWIFLSHTLLSWVQA